MLYNRAKFNRIWLANDPYTIKLCLRFNVEPLFFRGKIMELLRDKSVLNLIEELRGKLRRKGIEDKTIPRFVFICGEQILDN